MQNDESLCEMRIVSGTMQKQDVVVQIDVNIGTFLPALLWKFCTGFLEFRSFSQVMWTAAQMKRLVAPFVDYGRNLAF